jgi:hypothetical protein
MACYVHHVPGRLRIKTLAVKRNESRARQMKTYLEEMHGVLDAEINILTGSIVIKYDACLVSSITILVSLRDQGYIHNTDVVPNRATHGVHLRQKVADAFIAKLVETAVERSAIALIAAVI